MKKRGRSGFTLVEIVIVLAIFSILMAWAAPMLGGFQATGAAADRDQKARTLYFAAQNALNNMRNSGVYDGWLKGEEALPDGVAAADIAELQNTNGGGATPPAYNGQFDVDGASLAAVNGGTNPYGDWNDFVSNINEDGSVISDHMRSLRYCAAAGDQVSLFVKGMLEDYLLEETQYFSNSSFIIEFNKSTGVVGAVVYVPDTDEPVGYTADGRSNISNRSREKLTELKQGYYGVKSTGQLLKQENVGPDSIHRIHLYEAGESAAADATGARKGTVLYAEAWLPVNKAGTEYTMFIRPENAVDGDENLEAFRTYQQDIRGKYFRIVRVNKNDTNKLEWREKDSSNWNEIGDFEAAVTSDTMTMLAKPAGVNPEGFMRVLWILDVYDATYTSYNNMTRSINYMMPDLDAGPIQVILTDATEVESEKRHSHFASQSGVGADAMYHIKAPRHLNNIRKLPDGSFHQLCNINAGLDRIGRDITLAPLSNSLHKAKVNSLGDPTGQYQMKNSEDSAPIFAPITNIYGVDSTKKLFGVPQEHAFTGNYSAATGQADWQHGAAYRISNLRLRLPLTLPANLNGYYGSYGNVLGMFARTTAQSRVDYLVLDHIRLQPAGRISDIGSVAATVQNAAITNVVVGDFEPFDSINGETDPSLVLESTQGNMFEIPAGVYPASYPAGSIALGRSMIGGISGWNTGYAVIKNCHMMLSMELDFAPEQNTYDVHMGGIIGYAEFSAARGGTTVKNSPDISNCYVGVLPQDLSPMHVGAPANLVKYFADNPTKIRLNLGAGYGADISSVGGVAGRVGMNDDGNGADNVFSCVNLAQVSMAAKSINVGGITGMLGGGGNANNFATISNCWNAGTVGPVQGVNYTGNNFFVGGLVGRAEQGSIIEFSYNTGRVNIDHTTAVNSYDAARKIVKLETETAHPSGVAFTFRGNANNKPGIGGIVGGASGRPGHPTTIRNVYNAGAVGQPANTAQNNRLKTGGIAGTLRNTNGNGVGGVTLSNSLFVKQNGYSAVQENTRGVIQNCLEVTANRLQQTEILPTLNTGSTTESSYALDDKKPYNYAYPRLSGERSPFCQVISGNYAPAVERSGGATEGHFAPWEEIQPDEPPYDFGVAYFEAYGNDWTTNANNRGLFMRVGFFERTNPPMVDYEVYKDATITTDSGEVKLAALNTLAVADDKTVRADGYGVMLGRAGQHQFVVAKRDGTNSVTVNINFTRNDHENATVLINNVAQNWTTPVVSKPIPMEGGYMVVLNTDRLMSADLLGTSLMSVTYYDRDRAVATDYFNAHFGAAMNFKVESAVQPRVFFGGNDGSPLYSNPNPYHVRSARHLVNVGGGYTNVAFAQSLNIDGQTYGGAAITAAGVNIGTAPAYTCFTGAYPTVVTSIGTQVVYDGGKKSISGVRLGGNADGVSGLFGTAGSGGSTIKNVVLDSPVVSLANGITSAGGLVGTGTGNLQIETCTVRNLTTNGSVQNYHLGGLVGQVAGEVNISGSRLEGFQPTFASAGKSLGGIVGHAQSGTLTLSGNQIILFQPSITVPIENVGGLVGTGQGITTTGNVIEDYRPAIQATVANVGGVLGAGTIGTNNLNGTTVNRFAPAVSAGAVVSHLGGIAGNAGGSITLGANIVQSFTPALGVSVQNVGGIAGYGNGAAITGNQVNGFTLGTVSGNGTAMNEFMQFYNLGGLVGKMEAGTVSGNTVGNITVLTKEPQTDQNTLRSMGGAVGLIGGGGVTLQNNNVNVVFNTTALWYNVSNSPYILRLNQGGLVGSVVRDINNGSSVTVSGNTVQPWLKNACAFLSVQRTGGLIGEIRGHAVAITNNTLNNVVAASLSSRVTNDAPLEVVPEGAAAGGILGAMHNNGTCTIDTGNRVNYGLAYTHDTYNHVTAMRPAHGFQAVECSIFAYSATNNYAGGLVGLVATSPNSMRISPVTMGSPAEKTVVRAYWRNGVQNDFGQIKFNAGGLVGRSEQAGACVFSGTHTLAPNMKIGCSQAMNYEMVAPYARREYSIGFEHLYGAPNASVNINTNGATLYEQHNTNPVY